MRGCALACNRRQGVRHCSIVMRDLDPVYKHGVATLDNFGKVTVSAVLLLQCVKSPHGRYCCKTR
jgi:hypothetical protein